MENIPILPLFFRGFQKPCDSKRFPLAMQLLEIDIVERLSMLSYEPEKTKNTNQKPMGL